MAFAQKNVFLWKRYSNNHQNTHTNMKAGASPQVARCFFFAGYTYLGSRVFGLFVRLEDLFARSLASLEFWGDCSMPQACTSEVDSRADEIGVDAALWARGSPRPIRMFSHTCW